MRRPPRSLHNSLLFFMIYLFWKLPTILSVKYFIPLFSAIANGEGEQASY
jgi:hypothetical protein